MEKLGQFLPLINIMVFSAVAAMLLSVILLILAYRLYRGMKKKSDMVARKENFAKRNKRRQEDAVYSDFKKEYQKRKDMESFARNGPPEPKWQ